VCACSSFGVTFRATLTPYVLVVFSFQCHAAPRDLHSFPTRRSSDLGIGDLDAGRRPADSAVAGHLGRVALLDRYGVAVRHRGIEDRKSTRLNSSHLGISYAVFCLKKKNNTTIQEFRNKTHTTTLPYS